MEKKFYLSKMVWLGIIQTLIGSLGLIAEFLQKGEFSPASTVILFSGVLTVVLRVWFTDSAITK